MGHEGKNINVESITAIGYAGGASLYGDWTAEADFDVVGNVTGANLSGINTGDQTVTVEAAEANSSITPVANGTYTVGQGLITNGTITVASGIITAIQEAT